MDAVIALYASAAVLLMVAGALKVARPATTESLIEELAGPTTSSYNRKFLVIALGVCEVTLGVVALVAEVAAIGVFVGVMYLAFAATVVRAMSFGSKSCGCFGRADAPPSWVHVAGNVGLAVCSFVAVSGPSPVDVMEDQPWAGVGFVAVVGVLAGLELIVFTALPEAMSARRRSGAG